MNRPTWTYDGHGINGPDEYRSRLATFEKRHENDGGGYRLARVEQDRIGHLMAAAPELLEALVQQHEELETELGNDCTKKRQPCAVCALIDRATARKES